MNPFLAWLEVKFNCVQKDWPEVARRVIDARGGRCVKGRNGDRGKLLELWPEPPFPLRHLHFIRQSLNDRCQGFGFGTIGHLFEEGHET